MSIFIKVNRFGSAERLLRSRSLVTHLGTDHLGVFGTENIKAPFCSLFSVGTKYVLIAHHPTAHLNNTPLSVEESVLIAAGDNVTIADFTLTLFPTSPSAEVLASIPTNQISEVALQEVIAPSLELSLNIAHISRRYPLFDGVTFSVGATENNLIPVTLSGVADRHCTIKRHSNDTIVQPLNGKCAVNGTDILEATTFIGPFTLLLLPAGIPLRIDNTK